MKKILIIIPEGFEFLEAAAFTDVAGWARDVLKVEICTYLCGLSQEVKASFSFGDVAPSFKEESKALTSEESANVIKAGLLVDGVSASDFDALAIPGGFGKYGFFKSGFDERILKLVKAFDADKKPIAAVCTAALVLAKSGILNERKATTYSRDSGMYRRQLAEYGVEIVEDDIVISDNVITSSGPKTAPLVAIKLVEMLTNEEVADELMYVMGYEK